MREPKRRGRLSRAPTSFRSFRCRIEDRGLSPPSGDVLLGDFEGLDLEPAVEGRTEVDPGRPLVLGVHHDVLGAVGLGHGEDVDPGHEDVLPQEPLRFLQQERIEAVADPEEELSANEALSGLHVERVGQLVDTTQDATGLKLVQIEDRVVVYEDIGYAAWRARLRRCRRRRRFLGAERNGRQDPQGEGVPERRAKARRAGGEGRRDDDLPGDTEPAVRESQSTPGEEV